MPSLEICGVSIFLVLEVEHSVLPVPRSAISSQQLSLHPGSCGYKTALPCLVTVSIFNRLGKVTEDRGGSQDSKRF